MELDPTTLDPDAHDTTTPDPDAYDSLTVRAYVRPSLLFDPVDAKIETLEAIEADGVVAEVTVEAWPDAVRVDGEPTFPRAVDTFERFETWAETAGTSIRPPFTVRTVTSEFTGETKRLLEPPIFCLAFERNGQLVNVVPHSDGDRHRTVTEALSALEPPGDVAKENTEVGEVGEATPGSGPTAGTASTTVAEGPDATDATDGNNEEDGPLLIRTRRCGHPPEVDSGHSRDHD